MKHPTLYSVVAGYLIRKVLLLYKEEVLIFSNFIVLRPASFLYCFVIEIQNLLNMYLVYVKKHWKYYFKTVRLISGRALGLFENKST